MKVAFLKDGKEGTSRHFGEPQELEESTQTKRYFRKTQMAAV